MTGNRKIRKVFKSKPTLEGAGVHFKRIFGFSHVLLFDPFLLLDDFRSDNPEHYIRGFPWHPHRGIETITYVLHGNIEHGDSLVQSFAITVTYLSSDPCQFFPMAFFEQNLQIPASKYPLELFCDLLVMALESEDALLRFGQA